ncbi:hypothetical protein RYX36_020243 [Vicia faba]
METLRQLALDGHTVICSIHQPRGSMYSKFDDIVLLTEGSLVYAGPARDEPLEYLSKFGYHYPDHVNPAEFLADLIFIDYSSSVSVHSSKKRIDGLVESLSQKLSTIIYATPITIEDLSKSRKRFSKSTIAKRKGGWWKQFWLLLRRAWMQASRDAPTNKVRARMSIASAVIFGSVFWRMGKSQTPIQDRMGLLQDEGFILVDYFHLIITNNFDIFRFGKFCGIVTAESFAASAMGLTVGAMVPTTEAAMAKNKPKYQQLETTHSDHDNPHLKLEEFNSEQADQTHEAPETCTFSLQGRNICRIQRRVLITFSREIIKPLTLSGFNVIDDIKDVVEAKCPKTVSCADILALAAKDAVSAQKDGTISKRIEALDNIPRPIFNFTELKQNSTRYESMFQSDVALLTQNQSAGIVEESIGQNRFFTEFAQSMKRMGDIDILIGSAGEIRIKCYVVNTTEPSQP